MESLKKKFSLAERLSSTAVRGCIEAVDQIMSKQILNAFCLSRPPGHHALNTGKDEGFLLLQSRSYCCQIYSTEIQ